MPSNDLSLCASISLRIAVMMVWIALFGSAGSGTTFCATILPPRSVDRHRRLRRMDVERDDCALMVQFEKCRSATARRSSRRAFEDPLLLDQVFDNQRDRAALQAGTRARSARDSGWRVPHQLKTRLRLICRGVLFDALCLRVNVNRDD